MFRNYFISAFRNFWRNKVFSAINIAGLSIGISASIVIYLIVSYEFSFEKFRENGDRIYRVVTNMHFPDQDFKNSGVPGPLPEAMRKDVAGIEESAVFWVSNLMKVKIGANDKEGALFRKQDNIIYADDHYFKLFPYKWISGSGAGVLNEPNSVVLTKRRAKVYFPFADPANAIGQTITYDDSIHVKVTGIVDDVNEVTDMHFDEFISLSTFSESLKQNNGWSEWGSVSSSSQFFIRFRRGIDTASINRSLADLRKRYSGQKELLATDHFLQPLYDIHFNSDFDAFDQRQGNRPTLSGLMVVAVFLLLLGAINFINLITAQATRRAKEIGIRKTMGGYRRQLVLQFLCETLAITTIAALLSLLLTPWILKVFAEYIPEGLKLSFVHQPGLIIFLVVLVLVVSLFSGFYPAIVLSSFKPVTVLKNAVQSGSSKSRGSWVRKSLTVSQFIIAQFFIIATLIVGKQIRFSLDKDLGFKKEAIIIVPTHFDEHNPLSSQTAMMAKMKMIPGIEAISLSDVPPASDRVGVTTFHFNKDGRDINTSAEVFNIDSAYIRLYHIKLLGGRNLEQSDTVKEYMVNESFARLLGFAHSSDIIGKSFDRGDGSAFPIIGVVADFHTKSMHTAIQPIALRSQLKAQTIFHIALGPKGSNSDSWKTTIASIGAIYKNIYPEDDFTYQFFDESIAKFYKKDQLTAGMLKWIAGLTIFISCLGLLGLVIYTTSQRTKEIGIRKVLGASVAGILRLLTKEFLVLAIVAILIASPLAWWAMHIWLNDFAYRIGIHWSIFLLAGTLIIAIALLTISFQAIKAATANPVKSLRTE